jgi:16S rRNA (cytosine967-C5)-methyltransferase
MKADPVRRRAHEILIAVEDGQPLDRVLAEGLNLTTETRDRAFLAELVRGTVQWQGRYDHLIKRFSRKKAPDDAPTVTLLRMSLHQMIGQQAVPAYAAIHQAGELCRLQPGKRKQPFVNGMLQSVKREVLEKGQVGSLDPAERENNLRPFFETPGADRCAGLAAWQSHPLWLVQKWVAQFGWEKTEAICTWNNRPVPLVFHVLAPVDPATAARELDDAGCPVTAGASERTLVAHQRMGRGILDEILEKFPWLIVQDPTVQQATAWLAAEIPATANPGGLPVLDMCAAPGGKTAFLAANCPLSVRIVAMDPHPERIRMLAATMKRIETDRVDVLLADGNQAPFGPGKFSAVLLDGPCSGTGVLRHHPEGRWRLKKCVLARKAGTLARLAGQAGDLLAPGGLLMYATCSVEPEENEEVVNRLLAECPDLETCPDGEGRWRRLWLPGEISGDGFFAARLRKKG